MKPSPAAPEPRQDHGHPPIRSRKDLALLSLAALGVVYGDIGTSPLYAVKECFDPSHHITPTHDSVLGMLSIIFWALLLVVSVKYLVLVVRADNQGNGGIMALMALMQPLLGRRSDGGPTRTRTVLVTLGLFAAALLFGEGVITPAISVLGAVEGLEVRAHWIEPFLVPLTLLILGTLFFFQQAGTARIARVAGPAMLVWFTTIAMLGFVSICREPEVLLAVNPWYMIRFFVRHGLDGYLILGAAVLCITGAEALYADLGHFGRRPIRTAWFAVAWPALLLNYFGQGALLLRRTDEGLPVVNPFYELAPSWMIVPLVALATLAAVIASQALISAAFSISQQAMHLGYLPRLSVAHTSSQARGQIYVPAVNWGLMVACLTLVLLYRTSSGLAAAYGVAVVGTMTTTSILMFVVARRRWGWSLLAAAACFSGFLFIDVSFLVANLVKLISGAWVPLLMGASVYAAMSTWKRGRASLAVKAGTLPMELFLQDVREHEPPRVDGTAVFLTGRSGGVPGVLLHHYKHNKVLHRQVLLLTIEVTNAPRVKLEERVEVESLGQGFFRALVRVGYMESPSVPRLLELCRTQGLNLDPDSVSYYLGRETIITTTRKGPMAYWRKKLFSLMSRNARPATHYFGLPPNRVVELGSQVEL